MVEVCVEAHDPAHTVPFKDSDVQRITGGERHRAEEHVLREVDVRRVDRIHLVDDAEEGVEGRLDRIETSDGCVAVEDFLEHLDVGDQRIAPRDRRLEKELCPGSAMLEKINAGLR